LVANLDDAALGARRHEQDLGTQFGLALLKALGLESKSVSRVQIDVTPNLPAKLYVTYLTRPHDLVRSDEVVRVLTLAEWRAED
jgi:hypothetical protein